VSQEPAPKINLIDDAFVSKAQAQPGFRQALILDHQAVLATFSITPEAEQRLQAILRLLDSMTRALVDSWVEQEELREVLADTGKRRVLLFASREAASVFELSPEAREELGELAQMANGIAEVLFGASEQ